MTAEAILEKLQSLSNEGVKAIYRKHGAPENIWGVKVGDMKPLVKKIKKDYKLSLELFESGISDARYFAGLIADETKMTAADLQHWADEADWYLLSEYTVPWIAAESAHGWKLALKWIDDPRETVQSSGWSTLASMVGLEGKTLQQADLKKLLHRVLKELPDAQNRVRYAMNGFLISVGGYVPELSEEAISIGKQLGKVKVDMGGTACKVPFAPDYIKKMQDKSVKKKKQARC